MSRPVRKQVWAAVAEELGGTYVPDPASRSGYERIEVQLRGAQVIFDVYYAAANNRMPNGRVRAAYLDPPGPVLGLAKEGSLATIGKLFGIQDHQLGDPQFDNSFRIKGDGGVALARRLLTPEARVLLMRWFREGYVTSSPEGVELVQLGFWEEPDLIRAGIQLIAELASRDLHGRAILNRVKGTLSRDEDGWPRVELDTGTRVVIRAEIAGDQLGMTARATERGSAARGTWKIDDGQLEVQLPPAAQVAIARVGSGTLTIDDRGICFDWHALDVDPAQLDAGATLVGALASASGQAYR